MEVAEGQIINRPVSPVFYHKILPDQLQDQANETDDESIVYPETDGEPMGETEIHIMAIVHLYQALVHFFRNHDDVYTIADMLMYYKKGNIKAFKVPDVMVVKGVEKHVRRIFKLWEEKNGPCVIFEITSKSTAAEDIAKSMLYASLGVREYFLFDPLREYLEEGLLGFRLDGQMYKPVSPAEDGTFFSEELGLRLKREDHLLRIVDPESGLAVPSFNEIFSTAEKAERRAEEEARKAKGEARRAEEEARKAKGEARRAEEEARKAEEERQKAARLAARLREMGIDPESV